MASVQEILMLAVDELGVRNQVSPAQALFYLNEVQKFAFNRDMEAFLEFVPVDPAKATVDGWVYYPDSDPIAPSDPVRKMLGITTQDVNTFLNIPPVFGSSAKFLTSGSPTYSNAFSIREIPRLVPIVHDIFGRKIALPGGQAWSDGMYFVYYRTPPKITSYDNDQNLWVPKQYHMTLLCEGVRIYMDRAVYGVKENLALHAALEQICKPFWDDITGALDPDGEGWRSEGLPC